MSNDIAHARIWIQHGDSEHPRTRSAHQAMSHYIRQGVYECASLRMTAGKIKQRLMYLYDKCSIPSRRRPTSRQVDNIVHHTRTKGRLDADPIKAIGIFAEQNPEKVFKYVADLLLILKLLLTHRHRGLLASKFTILKLNRQRSSQLASRTTMPSNLLSCLARPTALLSTRLIATKMSSALPLRSFLLSTTPYILSRELSISLRMYRRTLLSSSCRIPSLKSSAGLMRLSMVRLSVSLADLPLNFF